MSKESNPMSERRWLAAYVKMHHEKKVRDQLTEMGIEIFCPCRRMYVFGATGRRK